MIIIGSIEILNAMEQRYILGWTGSFIMNRDNSPMRIIGRLGDCK